MFEIRQGMIFALFEIEQITVDLLLFQSVRKHFEMKGNLGDASAIVENVEGECPPKVMACSNRRHKTSNPVTCNCARSMSVGFLEITLLFSIAVRFYSLNTYSDGNFVLDLFCA